MLRPEYFFPPDTRIDIANPEVDVSGYFSTTQTLINPEMSARRYFQQIDNEVDRILKSGQDFEQQIKDCLVDINALNVGYNHLLLHTLLQRFIYSLISPSGNPTDEQTTNSTSEEAKFFGSKYREHSLWRSFEEFQRVVLSLNYINLYPIDWLGGIDGDPILTPVWIVGKFELDEEESRYLGVSLNRHLPIYAQSFKFNQSHYYSNKFVYKEDQKIEETLEKKRNRLPFEIMYPLQQFLAKGIVDHDIRCTLGIFEFTGPHELPLYTDFTLNGLSTLRRVVKKGKVEQYKINPMAIAYALGDRSAPVVYDVCQPKLTDIDMVRFDVLPHLQMLLDIVGKSRDVEVVLNNISQIRSQIGNILMDGLMSDILKDKSYAQKGKFSLLPEAFEP